MSRPKPLPRRRSRPTHRPTFAIRRARPVSRRASWPRIARPWRRHKRAQKRSATAPPIGTRCCTHWPPVPGEPRSGARCCLGERCSRAAWVMKACRVCATGSTRKARRCSSARRRSTGPSSPSSVQPISFVPCASSGWSGNACCPRTSRRSSATSRAAPASSTPTPSPRSAT